MDTCSLARVFIEYKTDSTFRTNSDLQSLVKYHILNWINDMADNKEYYNICGTLPSAHSREQTMHDSITLCVSDFDLDLHM